MPLSLRRQAVVEVLKDLLVVGVLYVLIRVLIGAAYVVPTGSMLPTIQLNDRLWGDKLWLRFHALRRGDIIIFDPPFPSDVPYVKRLIGLPGDQVEVREGKVWVNGVALSEPYIAAPPLYHWGPSEVPPGHYIVLGDNRNFSRDSHAWDSPFLPADRVEARAVFRFWPLNRIGRVW